MTLSNWNDRYAAGHAPTAPTPLLVEAASALPPGRALDLASGAGRHAVWLAGRGWDVVALDGSSEAIRLLREEAPHVDARVVDLEDGDALPFDDASFDLVLILFYLHRPLFAEAARLLRPGGTLVAANRTCGINPHYCVAPGELRSLFAGWDVVIARDDEVSELVVRKPLR